MTTSHVLVAPDAETFARCALAFVLEAAAAAIAARGRFRIALAGGSTPAPLYRALATQRDAGWSQWELFWSDERCVPPNHPESNFGMARATLLEPLAEQGLAPAGVHRLEGERPPDEAAARAEATLRALAGGAIPSLDLILLGMGADGHTASLFPHTDALAVRDRLVVANHVPALDTTRLTFTYPLINRARAVLMLVRGGDKAGTLHAVLEGPRDVTARPVQGVAPAGALTWLLDAPAAAALQNVATQPA